MGRYFNPATEEDIIAAGGRLITGDCVHSSLVCQLNPGEALGMFSDRIRFKHVPDVTDQREFEEFVRQYDQGIILLIGFYAIPEDKFTGGRPYRKPD